MADKVRTHEHSGRGCAVCGEFPVILSARCHPAAPMRVQMNKDGELELYCYVQECNRFVARFEVKQRLPQ